MTIRVYDLARELKQDIEHIIEDLRREGADIIVPSNRVSHELAEKFRLKYTFVSEKIKFIGFDSKCESCENYYASDYIEVHRKERCSKKSDTSSSNPEIKIKLRNQTEDKSTQPIILPSLENHSIPNYKIDVPNLSKEIQKSSERLLLCSHCNVNVKQKRLKKHFSICPALKSKTNALSGKSDEHQFIEECKEMSFEELANYINNCLEELKKQAIKIIIPQNRKTYKHLLTILGEKAFQEDNANKLLYFVEEYWIQNDSATQQSLLNEISKLNESIGTLLKTADEKSSDLKNYIVRMIRQNQSNANQTEYKKKQEVISKLRHKVTLQFRKIIRDWGQTKANSSNSPIAKNKDNDDFFIFEQLQNLENITPLKIEILPWKILPRGEWNSENLIHHFKKLITKSKWRGKKVDENRIMKIEFNLVPVHKYIGERKFEGYIVYCFDWTEKVILECPFYGNATYVIKGDWKEITKVSKWMAKYEYSNQVTVIRHSKLWFENLKTTLKNPY